MLVLTIKLLMSELFNRRKGRTIRKRMGGGGGGVGAVQKNIRAREN